MYGSEAASRDLNLNGKEDSDADNQHHQQQMSSLLGDMCEDLLPHRPSMAASEAVFTRLAPRQHLQSFSSVAAAVEESCRVASSVGMEGEQETCGVNGASLVRHSSSPAGLFSNLGAERGYAVLGSMERFTAGACSTGEATMADSRLRGHTSFLSRQSSSSTSMSQISGIGREGMGGSSPEGGPENGRYFVPGFPMASWGDPSHIPDSFSGRKRARDPSEAQIGDVRCHVPSLSHHYSLPKTPSEMAAIVSFQDALPCKIRAKRGCATHPRSIAERVRRTRISERMRKLQELVPNMDKQTSTADMLDLALEFIKDLEKQVKSLSESRANCTCSNKQKP